MSKCNVGDKVVIEITNRFKNAYGHEYYSILDSVYSTEFIDEKSEPLGNYTEPLEAKIRRQAAEITRLLAENKELKEQIKFDLPTLISEEDRRRMDINKARAEGQKEAWELAKKIACQPINGGFKRSEFEEIFGCDYISDIFEKYKYHEAATKVAEWEKAKEEIKVGDIVKNRSDTPNKFYVTKISSYGRLYGIGGDGDTYTARNPENWEKTGRHIDIDGFLKQIRGEQE